MSKTTKVFFLGGTGYIGGSVLIHLKRTNPDLEITALVRNKEGGESVIAGWKNARYVVGDLDSDDLIAEESSKADIVIGTAHSDHTGHIKSIYRGMAKHQGTAYFIHTSGTGILIDLTGSKPGAAQQTEISDKIYDDVANISDIVSLPISNLHMPVDHIIRDEVPPNVKQVIVCPPLIYGVESGHNRRSIQIPQWIQAMLKQGEVFTVNEGLNVWSNVHISDLAELYVLLVNEALKPNGGAVTWGREGFYFAENGEHVFADVAQELARIAYSKGTFPTKEVKRYNKEKVDGVNTIGAFLWGSNSRSRATRARKELGWNPHHPSLNETLEEELLFQAKAIKFT